MVSIYYQGILTQIEKAPGATTVMVAALGSLGCLSLTTSDRHFAYLGVLLGKGCCPGMRRFLPDSSTCSVCSGTSMNSSASTP